MKWFWFVLIFIIFFSLYLSHTALAHYHAAISIDINSTKSSENNKRDEFQLNNNNSIALSDLTSDTDVDPCALKKAHIKESIICYEEALRLQRMSRDLKVYFIWNLNKNLKFCNLNTNLFIFLSRLNHIPTV